MPLLWLAQNMWRPNNKEAIAILDSRPQFISSISRFLFLVAFLSFTHFNYKRGEQIQPIWNPKEEGVYYFQNSASGQHDIFF